PPSRRKASVMEYRASARRSQACCCERVGLVAIGERGMIRYAEPSDEARSGKLLLKALFQDLLQASSQGSAQEPAQEGDVAGCVDMLIVDRHLDPESRPIDPHTIPVATPIRPLDHRSERPLDIGDGLLQAGARFSETTTMLERDVNQGHRSA